MVRKFLTASAAALFAAAVPACSADEAAASQRSAGTVARTAAGEGARESSAAVPADRRRLVEEAVSAVRETQNALSAIDAEDREEAIAALERATGKLEILLARDPGLALAPVDVGFVTLDLLSDEAAVERLREQAEEALEEGRLQTARRLIANLGSETVMSVSHLPLATYPDAIKRAAALLERGEADEAKTVLQTALNTLVVQETVFPLPLIRARAALDAAEALAEKEDRSAEENRRLAALLTRARQELRFAEVLGYGSGTSMAALHAELDRIEEETGGERHGRRLFDRFEGLFDRANEASQPLRRG